MRKVALIGAGRGGSALLPILCDYEDVEVVGVADRDKNAQGMKYARDKNIPIYYDYFKLLDIRGLAVVLNLTGDAEVSENIRNRNSNVEILGALSAKLLWDLVYERKRKEDEKIKLLGKLAKTNHDLHKATNYLESILKHSGDMIITTDLNTKIVRFNKTAEDILGYTREEVIGNPVEKLYVDENERKKIIKKLENGESLSNYETRLKKKDGSIVDISLTLSLLKNDAGNMIGTVGISKDITDKKKLEEEILRSNKELANFVYTVSHDLQAPLRAMDGFSDLLLDEYKDKLDKEGIRYIGRIKNGAERMKMLIEDLLELSKIGRVINPYEHVSAKGLVEEIKDNLQYDLEKKNADIVIDDLPEIYCDRVRIQQVFVNLIANAIKYTKKGVAPRVKIGYKEIDDCFEFYIKDNGIGINRKYFSKIFDLFQRLHNMEEYEGTGIGLTIVNRIIEIHKGKIWLDSEEGAGTTFYFTLPRHINGSQEETVDI